MKQTSRWIRFAVPIALVVLCVPATLAGELFQGQLGKGAKAKRPLLHAVFGCHRGHCGHCGLLGGACCGGCCGAGGVLGHAIASAQSAMHSGQPLIDPWARADWIAQQQAATRSWHAGYYETQYGVPLALVVPPHARTETRWGWGVAQTTVVPIYHQFKRPYPGPVGAGEQDAVPVSPLLPTPRWPSHTDQFGVYSVRGPW